MGVAYGWAPDRQSEHWHISRDLGEAITEAAGEDHLTESDVPLIVAWLCKAHKLRIDEILNDGMVEGWLEHLDEKAGEVSGIQDPLFKSVGNDWHERVRKTRESIAGAMQTLWEDALWYHEVDMVAPLQVHHSAIESAGLVTGDWVRWKESEEWRWQRGWWPFSGIEEPPKEDFVLLGLGGAYRQVPRGQKIWVGRVGEWSRFGEV